MQHPRWIALLFSAGTFSISACGGGGGGDSGNPPPPPPPAIDAWFNDVTGTHVDQSVIDKACMDVQTIDYDADNDLDLILAIEFGRNVLLQNDGNGRFAAVSSAVGMLENREDHEDIALADFDGDSDIDIAVAAEDTAVHEIYLDQGNVFSGYQHPASSVANAVISIDFDDDTDSDLIFGGAGLLVLENIGVGSFSVYSGSRFPTLIDVIQDIATGDVDSDGDIDLFVATEGQNRLLLNDGTGHFTSVVEPYLPTQENESRVIALADIDDDEDLDLFVGNVTQVLSNVNPANGIYINNGAGLFTATSDQVGFGSYGGHFVDFDGDGDPDLITASANILDATDPGGFRLFRNDAAGFTDVTQLAFGGVIREHGFGVANGDFNGDGKIDFYLCSRGAVQDGTRFGARDHLMLRK